MELKDEILKDKELRGKIDALIQEVKNCPATRERSLAITKLQEAVMWLGMDLKRIHDLHPEECSDPYVGSKDPNTGTYIAPTADGLKM